MGTVVGLVQSRIKRLFAYSTILCLSISMLTLMLTLMLLWFIPKSNQLLSIADILALIICNP
jgi:NADH:ubiquinone oxidoreductase subunit 2 (subunit N)